MYKKSEELNLEIIGIFHSHPKGEAYPSHTDEKFMKINIIDSNVGIACKESGA